MYNATTTTTLAYSLRRAIVPAGATAQTKRQLARLLLDLADELGQTGGMDTAAQHRNIGKAEQGEGAACAAARGDRETIIATLAAWKLEHAGKRAPRYIQQVEKLMLDLFAHAGKVSAAELGREDISGFLNHVGTVGRGRDIWHASKPAVAKTLNDYLGSIRSVLRWCVQTGRDGGGGCVADGIGWFGGRRGGMGGAGKDSCDERAFTLEECRAIIAAAPLHRAVLYRFMCETGMRIGTCEQLRRKHFDLVQCRVHAPGEIMKNRKGLSLPISPVLAEEIAEHVRQGGDGGGLEGWVFGKRPHRKSLDLDQARAGVAIADDMGRKAGFHGFRRFVASELLNRGVNPKAVQQRLDHADIRTTMKYNNVRQGAQQDITSVMAAMMDGAGASAVGGAGMVAGATGRGSAGVGGRQPYALQPVGKPGSGAGGAGAGAGGLRGGLRVPGQEWALQGSNGLGADDAAGAQQAGAQQDTVCRMIGMLMSGCSPRQAALVLRAVADTLLAESAAVAVPVGADGVSAAALGSISPPAPSVAAPIAQAG